MPERRKTLILLASAGSLALLLGALAFQHLGGLAPCKLCLWQRWPHGAAVAVGLAALVLPGRLWPALGALAAAVAAGLGLYHSGVEQGWWPGPGTCSAGSVAGLSPEDLLDQILSAPVVRCDEIAWSLAGLSMASWNALLSLCLVALWLAAARARG
jgi:disulfide bond formation protein DsbB